MPLLRKLKYFLSLVSGIMNDMMGIIGMVKQTMNLSFYVCDVSFEDSRDFFSEINVTLLRLDNKKSNNQLYFPLPRKDLSSK